MATFDFGLTRLLGRRSRAAQETVGAPGFVNYGNYVQEHEEDYKLAGVEKYRTFDNILANTSIVAAGVRYYLNLCARPAWSANPVDDSGQARVAAEFAEEIMTGMTTPWHRVVRRAAMYKFYGFSIQEWTARRRDDGRIIIRDVEPRPQRTICQWETDRSGTVTAVGQWVPQSGESVILDRGKIVYVVDDSITDSPQGLGLARHLVATARRLERYERWEGMGFETDMRGVPVGRAPIMELMNLVKRKVISQKDMDDLLKGIQSFVSNPTKTVDKGLLIDSTPYRDKGEQQGPSSTPQWGMELLSGTATAHEELASAIERLNREMARVLHVEQLLLGSDSAGSLALSRDKTQAFFMIIDSALRELAPTFQKDILGPAWRLNGLPEELMPELTVESVRFRDVEQMAATLRDMANAGAPLMPGDPAIDQLRDLMGLDAMPDLGELLLGQEGGAVTTGPNQRGGELASQEVTNPDDEGNEESS